MSDDCKTQFSRFAAEMLADPPGASTEARAWNEIILEAFRDHLADPNVKIHDDKWGSLVVAASMNTNTVAATLTPLPNDIWLHMGRIASAAPAFGKSFEIYLPSVVAHEYTHSALLGQGGWSDKERDKAAESVQGFYLAWIGQKKEGPCKP